MKRVAYSLETKRKAMEMKAAGKTNQEIMLELNIKNRSQVKTWWRWYQNGEIYRFHGQVGKQYTYGKGLEHLSEVERLKLQLKQKEAEIAVLKKVQGIGKVVAAEIAVQVVKSLCTRYPIKQILSILRVPSSTYYRWKQKDFQKEEIEEEIASIAKKQKYTYGYRKITAEINRNRTNKINHKKVQRIVQKYQLNCRVKEKKEKKIGNVFYRTANVLNRKFQATKPLERLVTDITYLPFGKKMMYLSSIMDLYNGEIIAYKISEKQDQQLVNATLSGLKIPSDCLLHSDQGSVYTSHSYYKLCQQKSVIRSMSRKGTPADNAPIECFHSSLKCETFYLMTEPIGSTISVIDIVQNYINNYNKNRIQQKLGYLSPVQYREATA
ncbi:IS3 family transposase [Listeria grayi]|uniref:IS3 family transposase n=1 Tax=Listeria grayi TaxID=1641 RepID=UPI0019013557|nr:IS3 family transposase [Listeria grayi]